MESKIAAATWVKKTSAILNVACSQTSSYIGKGLRSDQVD